MKKSTLLLIGILLMASCSTTDRISMTPTYSTFETERKDIRGDMTAISFVLFKKWVAFRGTYYITVNHGYRGIETETGIMVYWQGPEWAFINRLLIKTDNKLISLSGESQRVVKSDATVKEVLFLILSEENINDLMGTEHLTVQIEGENYNSNPYEIPYKGILELKKFLTSIKN